MVDLCRRKLSRDLSAIIIAIMLVLSGCAGVEESTDTSFPSSNKNVSPSSVPTDEPVGTAGSETDLDVRNYEDVPAALNISIIRNETDDVVFRKNLTVNPDEVYDFDVPFPELGNYTVRTTWNGTIYSYGWMLEYTDPSYELIIRPWDGKVRYTKSAA
ncbi:hypothetical protein IL252_12635 [Halomicrobium sp. IBSBa]|uniref:hypothetical protein n=1 Tax=Halomicrobium sp. IBSBa TaxID=2778916 RepID=UPI001ABFEFCE|nr:hypothetical protein [Halomicrobium sp. IBSBa]MBO4248661.1 hypothetical protein [Halomicrobium sp. IBSBa]